MPIPTAIRVPASYTPEQRTLAHEAFDGCLAADWLITARELALAVRDESTESALAYAHDIVKRLDRVAAMSQVIPAADRAKSLTKAQARCLLSVHRTGSIPINSSPKTSRALIEAGLFRVTGASPADYVALTPEGVAVCEVLEALNTPTA